MIKEHDRSYYIGASDTRYVVGNWSTKSFENWWLEKMGFRRSDFSNDAMKAGTAYEHKILDALMIPSLEKDKQILSGRLRVNLDGNTHDTIYEVKTYNRSRKFVVTKAYREQVQVEMYATYIRKAYIVAYGLGKEEYANFFLDIDPSRIKLFPIPYDDEFIDGKYLPRFTYLSRCLEQGRFPTEKNYGMQGNFKINSKGLADKPVPDHI